ncbi:MAG TPA: VWA domain-containing protein [Bacteroidia bacterium]|nr:VWA domain-containing protein [Bacteroidia bacterium]
MSFDYPWLLFLLLLALPVTLLWRNSAQKREMRIRKFTESIFENKLLVGNHPGLRRWHFILFFSATVLLIFALSGPMISGGKEKVKTTGIDIMVVLDVSNSMKAADIQPNRIERAKLALSQMISKMGTDRMGLVVFAGQAFTCLPLTDDHSAAEMVVQTVSPEMISMQGTAIGQAIDNAMVSFTNDEKDRGKAIILISDGENHEDNAADAAGRASDNGVIVCSIGIGSSEGATIPEFDSQGNPAGNKRDENGKEIITKLDEGTLKDVASEGRGIYVHATNADMGIAKIYSMLQGLNKTTKDTWRDTSFIPIYRWFLFFSILLFIVEALLPEGKRNEFNSRRA